VQDLTSQLASLRAEAALRAQELASARQSAASSSQVAVLQERLRDALQRAARAEANAPSADGGGSPQQRAPAASSEAIPSPTSGATETASLRQQLAAAVAAKGSAAAEVARLTAALTHCESQRDDAELRASAAIADASTARASLARCEHRVKLLQEERDALQRFLKAYDAEDEATRGTAAGATTSQLPGVAAPDALARQRAVRDAREAELGAALSRAHSRLAELEAECSRLQQSADAANKQAAAAGKRVAAAEKDAAALAREVGALHQRLGAGEFDVSKVRVLHLKANPEQQARQDAMRKQLDALAAENGDLKARVDALTQSARPGGSSSNAAGGGGPDATAVVAAECTVLRRRVADLEKRETRYKAVFAESIATVRDAVRCIFGYVLELALPGDTVTVRSALSGDDSHVLKFRLTRGDPAHGVEPTAELLPGPWSSRPDMKRSVDTFVTRCRSVPALTANLTVELFNATTLPG
jgi:mitotic spindle assembly checkpoint protein MAD1